MSDNSSAARLVAPRRMLSDTTSSPTPTATDTLVGALRRGDYAGAAHLFEASPSALPAEQTLALAEGMMRRRHWQAAAWLFARVPSRDPASDMKRCLAGNLAALEAHRPDVYQLVTALPSTDAFSIGAAAGGRPTILARSADGSLASLSPGGDPLASALAGLPQVKQASPNGEAVALCGIGDGYLLQSLAQHPPKLFMDMEQAVFVIEPEPQVLLHALMIHDYAGAAGPIAAERFRWFVGPGWADRLDHALAAEPGLGIPGVTVRQGADGGPVASRLQSACRAVAKRDEAARRELEKHYATVTAASLAKLFGSNPPRQPRVLLLTTRFSTVLQYSTRDTATAFEQLGWAARVLIEPAPSHRLYRHGIRQALAAFKPDLVFQIDHLRHEHDDVFPANLPFACWAQDHLPNLTTPAAGASVGARDFVLVGMPTMYVSRYGYPRERTLMLAKLTRIPERPAMWEADGEDLVYVSTASAWPADVAAQVVANFGGDSSEGRRLVETCCRRVTDIYARGDTLPAVHHCAEIIKAVAADTCVKVQEGEPARRLADALFDRLGNVLYRQQALAWLAEVAERHGLSLGIYGAGWDAHPLFKAYARGPVKYGVELEQLTRRSKINFTLEPYFSVSHQRLVDGLVAGGFFLVRHHPKNTLIQEISNFLGGRVSPSVATAAEANALLSPADRMAFDGLAARFGPMSEFADPVAFVRTSERASLVCPGDAEPLPELGAISFSNAAELETRVLRFIDDPPLRSAVSARQRRTMESRRSYVAGISRIVGEIGALLAAESDCQAAPQRVVQNCQMQAA